MQHKNLFINTVNLASIEGIFCESGSSWSKPNKVFVINDQRTTIHLCVKEDEWGSFSLTITVFSSGSKIRESIIVKTGLFLLFSAVSKNWFIMK